MACTGSTKIDAAFANVGVNAGSGGSSPFGSSKENDFSSFCNARDVHVVHSDIVWTADFSKKTLKGHVDVVAQIKTKGSEYLLLDTKGLNISKIEGTETWAYQERKGGDAKNEAVFGKALRVEIPEKNRDIGSKSTFRIHYETDPARCTAVQWLPPAQTAGKKHPFMFTQCQAIHARSLLPCQDTPGAKMTYTCKVTVPRPLVALMSALGNGADPIDVDDDTSLRTYEFKQPQAISSYLIALAIGELAFLPCSKRTGVWAEPSVVKKAAWEFAEVENMVAAGEKVCGEYRWGRYDVLCMPPSFPYGGMENPCLTFVTPTLLAGDRSLADVVIHEICHSWTGNLVTNLTWRHFWLNEGWTMFVQRKIKALLSSEQEAQLDMICRLKCLEDECARYGCTHNFTRLLPDLNGVDPDDSFSSVPYEKGFQFLYYLQSVVGGPKAFDPFVKAYVKTFAATPLTSADFQAFFLDYFKDCASTKTIDWDAWFCSPGMPVVENTFDTTLVDVCSALKKKWIAAASSSSSDFEPKSSDVANFTTLQTMLFLDSLQKPDAACVTTATWLRKMDKAYAFTEQKNAEVRFRWQTLCIRAEMPEIVPHVVRLITEQGRMKFTRPLYRDLFRSKMGKDVALATFREHRKIYHPICAKMVARDLNLCVPC